MAEAVLARLQRHPGTPLRPAEIGQSTGLARSDVIVALYELEDRGLVEPVEWRSTTTEREP